MLLDLLPQIVMLVAGAVTCIFALVKQYDGLKSVALLLGVLVGFYIIGCIAKKIIYKTIETKEEKSEQDEREIENIETGEEQAAEEKENESVTESGNES